MLKNLIAATLPSLPSKPWLTSTLTFTTKTEYGAADGLGNLGTTAQKEITVNARLRKPSAKGKQEEYRGRDEAVVEFVGVVSPVTPLDPTVAIGSKGTGVINGVSYRIKLVATAQSDIRELGGAIGARIRIMATLQSRADS